jgi:periplasmic protein TonB
MITCRYLIYPQKLIEKKIEGMVIAEISINSHGYITNVKANGKNELLNEEVIRVLSLMPKWKHGSFNENPIETSVTRNFYFSLEKSKMKNGQRCI